MRALATGGRRSVDERFDGGRTAALDERRGVAVDGPAAAGRPAALDSVRERALAATDVAVVVTEAAGDHPIVWCNPAFERLTGYRAAEVVGWNCRFLQGRSTDPAAVARIREALAAGEAITELLLNHRKDGTSFWNQLRLSPVRDADGAIVHFVGVQLDVTERVLVQHEREAALAAAEEARQGLALLTQAGDWLTESLDTDDVARRLVGIATRGLADSCFVDLLEQPGVGRSRRVAVEHNQAEQRQAFLRLAELVGPHVGGSDPISQVLSGGAPVLVPEMPIEPRVRADDPEVVRLYQALRPRSMIIVPLRARGRVIGALTLLTEQPYGRRYGRRDLHLATDLATRAGLAVDNARLYATEHRAAETLQRSLLPAVPDVDGVAVAARYLVSANEAKVGGDWYDLLPLPDGAIGLAVGDVVGHDLRAAAAMGELRGVLRAYAWEGLAPGDVLDRCDRLAHGLGMSAMATVVYGRLEPPGPDGVRTLRYANAGHPPPLLRLPDGSTHVLGDGLSTLVAAIRDVPPRASATVACPPGSLLLLHTDGLTDAPGLDAVARAGMLRDVVAEADESVAIDDVCALVLDRLATPELIDDVALLAVRVDR